MRKSRCNNIPLAMIAVILFGFYQWQLLRMRTAMYKLEAQALTAQPMKDEEVPAVPFDEEWWAKRNSFVPERPDLSGVDAEALPEIKEHVAQFFAASGLHLTQVTEVSYAVGPSGTLVRARVSNRQLPTLLKGKQQLREHVPHLLSSIYDGGEVTVAGPGLNEEATIGFQYLNGYPFVRLSWWPIPAAEATQMHAYLGSATWHFREMHPGHSYLLLVRDDGLIYILSL